jgi:membrane protein implicated in regulation of membrane protease activity
MQWGVQDNETPPRKPPPRRWPGRIVSTLSSLAFVAFVCWIVNGAAGGGHFLWWVVAAFAAPIVLYLLFIAAIGVSFVRTGKRNMREAQRRRRESGER